jgi:hypothetical protein
VSVTTGDTFTSRGGAAYTVTECRPDGGFTIERDATGKAVRISGRMLRNVAARLEAGEALAYQANAKNGGISYTVAIEAGVAHALRHLLERDDANRRYLPAGKCGGAA